MISNSAASIPAFVAEADRLRAELPPEVEATLRRHEAAGTTNEEECAKACEVYYHRHLCRLDPWPEGVTYGLAQIDADPTRVSHHERPLRVSCDRLHEGLVLGVALKADPSAHARGLRAL